MIPSADFVFRNEVKAFVPQNILLRLSAKRSVLNSTKTSVGLLVGIQKELGHVGCNIIGTSTDTTTARPRLRTVGGFGVHAK